MTDLLLTILAVSLIYCMIIVTTMSRELREMREADEHATTPAEGWDAVRRIDGERRP